MEAEGWGCPLGVSVVGVGVICRCPPGLQDHAAKPPQLPRLARQPGAGSHMWSSRVAALEGKIKRAPLRLLPSFCLPHLLTPGLPSACLVWFCPSCRTSSRMRSLGSSVEPRHGMTRPSYPSQRVSIEVHLPHLRFSPPPLATSPFRSRKARSTGDTAPPQREPQKSKKREH